MHVELYKEGEDYYTRLPGAVGSVHWEQESGNWRCTRSEIPPSALAARFEDMPAALQEEILALAARSEAVGGVEWGDRN